MKIALLTHHWVPNFGANLQALATYSFLKAKGHDVVVLNYIPKNLEQRYSQICSEQQLKMHSDFCSEHFKLSPLLRNENELRDFCASTKIDLIICGSDAILRLYKNGDSHEGPFPNPYWLNWAQSSNGIVAKKAYISASCTGSNYLTFPSAMRKNIYAALKNVDFISVRDKWTRFMLSYASGGRLNTKLSPDPVTIFNEVVDIPEQYECEPRKHEKKYILFSIHPKRISTDWVKKFVDACHQRGFQVYGLPFPEFEMPFDSFDKNIALPISPLEWYSWLRHAAGFVGERFHPMMCSLVNEVPFVTVDHYRKRGIKNHFMWFNIPQSSKIYSVCADADLVANCLHYPKLPAMQAQHVLDTLLSWDRRKAHEYNKTASAVFTSTLDSIVALPQA